MCVQVNNCRKRLFCIGSSSDIQNNLCTQHVLSWTIYVHNMFWAWNFHVLNWWLNEHSFVILWVSWGKKCFWKRFTCKFWYAMMGLIINYRMQCENKAIFYGSFCLDFRASLRCFTDVLDQVQGVCHFHRRVHEAPKVQS